MTSGRFVVSTSFLPSESVVLNTVPYAHGIFDSFKKRVCAICLSQATTLRLHCKQCDQIYVCSSKCMSEMFASAHHTVCKAYRKLATHKAPIHEKSVLKILLSILSVRMRETGIAFQLEHSQILKDALNTADIEFRLPSTVNSNKENSNVELSWQNIQVLQSHYRSWAQNELSSWKKTIAFITKLLNEVSLLFPDEDDEFVLDLISKIESNSFGLFSAKGVCMGRAVYPFASYFNHSCEPNCEVLQNEKELSVVTTRPVLPGDELNISYIDTNQPLSARRKKLREEYFFHCQCDRCMREEASSNSKITYMNPKKASQEMKATEKQKTVEATEQAVSPLDQDNNTVEERPRRIEYSTTTSTFKSEEISPTQVQNSTLTEDINSAGQPQEVPKTRKRVVRKEKPPVANIKKAWNNNDSY